MRIGYNDINSKKHTLSVIKIASVNAYILTLSLFFLSYSLQR